MMLNNHGWGMRDMIIYTCILLLFLLFVAYSVSSLYDFLSKPTENITDNQQPVDDTPDEKEEESPIIVDIEYYENVEKRLKNATLDYFEKNPTDLSIDILKLDLTTLVDLGYIDKIYDQTGEKLCVGYTNTYQDVDKDYIVEAYISCDNYITEGY